VGQGHLEFKITFGCIQDPRNMLDKKRGQCWWGRKGLTKSLVYKSKYPIWDTTMSKGSGEEKPSAEGTSLGKKKKKEMKKKGNVHKSTRVNWKGLPIGKSALRN